MSDEQQKKILIVDDDKLAQKLLSRILAKENYAFRAISDGRQCLDTIKNYQPDLILLDILMPEISGLEVLTLLRQQYDHLSLPIIMVTAKAESDDIVTALKSGANDYIVKPINFDIAITRLKTQLKMAELAKQLCKFKETQMLTAMITTYNHEINNPLAIALLCLSQLKDGNSEFLPKLEQALLRIQKITGDIRDLINREIEFESYCDGPAKLIKIK